MSTISCPVCQGAFREVLREGILIDVCTQCRGVWLDRGELEKLLSLTRGGDDEPAPRAAEPLRPQPTPQPTYEQPRQGYAQPPQGYRRDDDDDDYKRKHGHSEYDQYGRKRKKKGFDFADIFDFGD